MHPAVNKEVGVRVTKYVHSCLLIETENQTVLYDPGDYSVDSGLITSEELPELDALLITHGHFDHCNTPFIKRLKERFPQMPIISTQEVVSTLESEGIAAATEPPQNLDISREQAEHQPLPWRTPAPENWALTVAGHLTHPGDSLQISRTASVLALPMQAPWGAMRESFDMALELQPETIIPIHDWHWHDEARRKFYDKSQQFFRRYDITFISVEDGRPVDV